MSERSEKGEGQDGVRRPDLEGRHDRTEERSMSGEFELPELPEPRSYPMFCRSEADRHRWRLCLATADIMFFDPNMDTFGVTRLAAEVLFFGDMPT